ncbi:MAG: transglutaminase family protein [Planctomycetia bacterium]|nr:transglutaminase family protein [Planctomycetia bacterium]
MALRFHVSCRIDYDVAFPSTLIFNIHPQRNSAQTIIEEKLTIEPRVKAEEISIDGGENRFLRLRTGNKKKISLTYEGTVDCNYRFHDAEEIDTTSVAEMDQSAITFLFPSRYCQSDRLSRLAWDLFGKITNPYDQVVAIADWIHANVEYVRGSTNSETSAYDTVTQRTGVCRDFAHLGIAFCRALTIPARYFSGYAYQLQPPDFHACFEAYIGGRWLIFDATRLAHVNGLVRIGTARDAADAAVVSIFGRVSSTNIQVDCRLAEGQKYAPLSKKQLKHRGVSLDAR